MLKKSIREKKRSVGRLDDSVVRRLLTLYFGSRDQAPHQVP